MAKFFPPPESSDETGFIGITEEITSAMLLEAYQSGIFPWPISEWGDVIPWFSPPTRAVLFFENLKVPRSLAKKLNKFEVRFDSDLGAVIEACASLRSGGTWITPKIIKAYKEFEYCYSVEAYQEDELVGGLYGVRIGSFYAGESMFHTVSDASKTCLVSLVEKLREQGVKWIDCQQVSPLFESFGAKELPRARFLQLLEKSLA